MPSIRIDAPASEASRIASRQYDTTSLKGTLRPSRAAAMSGAIDAA